MAATGKSPRKILTVGYLIGKLALPDYAHKFSPKTYTQPQLFACLVLAAAIDLKKIPDFTTLQKAAGRLLVSPLASQLLDMTVRLGKFVGKLDAKAPLAAMDGTGLESRHASAYYVRRKAKGAKSEQKLTYQRFPKAGLVSECKSHLILAVVPQRGPGPDITHFRKAFDQARRRLRFTTLAADAGYDAEHTHVYGRSRGVRTLIPPLIGRPTIAILRTFAIGRLQRERDVWKHHAQGAKWMANLGVRKIEFDGDDITGQKPGGGGTFTRTWPEVSFWADDPSEGPGRRKRPPKPKRLP